MERTRNSIEGIFGNWWSQACYEPTIWRFEGHTRRILSIDEKLCNLLINGWKNIEHPVWMMHACMVKEGQEFMLGQLVTFPVSFQ
jgi:hypothetical protein